jgi:hypothetical protein
MGLERERGEEKSRKSMNQRKLVDKSRNLRQQSRNPWKGGEEGEQRGSEGKKDCLEFLIAGGHFLIFPLVFFDFLIFLIS